ncbi:type IV pilin N-terminal domain-containing protein, partial [Halapricum sp. CBA1109]|uniref:type IV pilin N-terminal domain-containing protein n=1 Tax=Halapricum sp. CBA1109 TaxID=2668068 RepID=UPI001E32A5DA
VDRMAAAEYGPGHTLAVVLGTFDADEPTFPLAASEPSVHREDGLFVAAMRSDGEAWPAGTDATGDAIDEETPLSADATLALAQVSEYEGVELYPSYSEDGSGAPITDVDGAEAVAFGGRRVDSTTVQMSLAAVFEDESAADADALETSFTESVSEGVDDVSVEQDGRVAVATLRADYPSEAVRERMPSVGIEARYDGEDGTVTLEHRGGDSVDTDRLTLLVEDDPVENPWSDGTFEAGDSVTVAVDPFAYVTIEWADPEAGLTRPIATELAVPRDAFESAYDPATESVTFTYTGERPVEATDRLEISHRSGTGERRPPDETTTEPLSERYGTLDPGTDIVIEGVSYATGCRCWPVTSPTPAASRRRSLSSVPKCPARSTSNRTPTAASSTGVRRPTRPRTTG